MPKRLTEYRIREPRAFTIGVINTLQLLCSLHRGAANNLLSLHIYSALVDQPPLSGVTAEFDTAAETQLNVIGSAVCNIQTAHRTTATPFYTLRNSVAAEFLRMPLLMQASTIVDVATEEIEFPVDMRTPITKTLEQDGSKVNTMSPTCYDCPAGTANSVA